MNEVEEIINMTKNNKYKTYTEFKLKKPINVSDYKELIEKLNNRQNITVTFNRHTLYCDIIGVYDDDRGRWFDFDDDLWTMTNKGMY